jgi:hypothetical protein
VEGRLERITYDEPGEEEFLIDLWEGGDAEDRERVLETLKSEVDVRVVCYDERPEFPA